MQAFLIRHGTAMKKLREVNIEIPDLLAGWHMLSRAGVPKWTHLQVKSLCGGTLSYVKVSQALLKMFGGDHKPNLKDLFRASGDSAHVYVADEDVLYEDDEPDEFYGGGYPSYDGDEIYWEVDEDGHYENEYVYAADDEDLLLPKELESAADAVDEAFMNYSESRRRMRDIALSRGFFPVVAMPPTEWSGGGFGHRSGGGGKGKSKGKGRAKGKGKGRGKSNGKGGDRSGFRKFAFSRRPTSGIRRDGAMNHGNPSSDSARSTSSGATSSHGPRFKRYRLQDVATKQAEDANMVVDLENLKIEKAVVEVNQAETVLFSEVHPGFAIMDSGATKSVIGDKTWQKWLALLANHGRQAEARKFVRDFRFGDGATIRSNVEVTFEANVAGRERRITASVIPGQTPLLLARPVLEEWKVLQDYATGKIKMQDSSEWISPTRTSNGHYLLELLPEKNENVLAVNLEDEPYVETPVILEPGEYPDDMEPSYDARLQDEARISEKEFQAAILAAEEVVMHEQSGRNKVFWELYVDKGSLSQQMARQPGTEAAVFGLPDWDLDEKDNQETFKKLMCEVMPSHIWMSPPCTLWSTTQNLNCRTEAQKRELLRKRQVMARRQLDFVYEIFLMWRWKWGSTQPSSIPRDRLCGEHGPSAISPTTTTQS